MAEVFDPNRLGLSSLQQNIQDAARSPGVYPDAKSLPIRVPSFSDLMSMAGVSTSYGQNFTGSGGAYKPAGTQDVIPPTGPEAAKLFTYTRPQEKIYDPVAAATQAFANSDPRARALSEPVTAARLASATKFAPPARPVSATPESGFPSVATGLENTTGVIDPRFVALKNVMEPGGIGSTQNMPTPGAPQPISIVRGLQEMVYKPQEGGGYKAELTDAQKAEAAAAAAKVDKDRAEAIKAVRGTGMDRVLDARMKALPTLEAALQSPQSTDEQKAKAKSEIDAIWADLFKLDYLTRYGISGVTGQNTGG